MLEQILYTAVVTPFIEAESDVSLDLNASGESIGSVVDYESFKKVLKTQEAAGNGVIILGSTGESLSLSLHERCKIVDFACQPDNKISTPMLVGVPGYNIAEALEWIDFCNDKYLELIAGDQGRSSGMYTEVHEQRNSRSIDELVASKTKSIDGYLMTAPLYTKPGPLGQTKWFEKLLDRAKKPAMLYNIPGRSAMKLHPETVANLKDHPNFLAIKDSGGSIESILDYKTAAPDIAVYAGDDYMMAGIAAEGAVGLVSVASNPWPVATRKYVESCLDFSYGKQNLDPEKLWWRAIKALFAASNPVPVKALLKDMGIIASDLVRYPLCQGDLSVPKRQELLIVSKLIQEKFQTKF